MPSQVRLPNEHNVREKTIEKKIQHKIEFNTSGFSRDRSLGLKSLIELEFILLWFQRNGGAALVCMYAEWMILHLLYAIASSNTDISDPSLSSILSSSCIKWSALEILHSSYMHT